MADLFDLPEDDFLLAGELSLGTLEGDDQAAAMRRQLAEPVFAEAVGWWDARLAAMAEAGEVYTPSRDVLRAIHARIDALPNSEAGRAEPLSGSSSGPGRWSIGLAALGTTMAAAALVLYVSAPTGTGTIEPAQQGPASARLVAQLQDEDGQRKLAGIIDPELQRLAINVSGLEAASGEITELWVIPADGIPRSLGKIPGAGSFERELTDNEARLLTEGSALAVTFEPGDGLPHDAPTLPILVVGTLDRV